MEIKFNKELSRVHDMMESLVLSFQDNYKLVYKDYNLNVSKAAEESFILINENVAFDIPGCELLFGRETELAVNFARSRYIPADVTVDNFADHLARLSEEEARMVLLANLNADEQKYGYDELQRMVQDENKTFAFISQTRLSPAVKWSALSFYKDVSSAMRALIGLVKKYIPVYKKILARYKKLIEPFEQRVAEGIAAEGKAFFSKLVRDSINLEADDITAGILFFRSRSLTCATVGQKLYVFIGLDYEETVRQALGDGDIALSIFKNLADKTRLQILNLLKGGDLYGLEIAEKVGITLATVSYHMSYLLAANLVKLEKVGQKGYYSLQKAALRSCVDFLNSHFALEQKGDEK